MICIINETPKDSSSFDDSKMDKSIHDGLNPNACSYVSFPVKCSLHNRKLEAAVIL